MGGCVLEALIFQRPNLVSFSPSTLSTLFISHPHKYLLPRFIIPAQAVADLVYNEAIVPLLPLGWGLPILLKFGKMYRVRCGDVWSQVWRCMESGVEMVYQLM
jgi:hypothetical protein